MRAIREPALECGVKVDEDTARKLVDDLRVVMVDDAKQGPKPHAGRYVEPVLLQVVCHRLWRRLCKDSGGQFDHIGVEDVQTVGRIDEALRYYYADVVNEASGNDSAVERIVHQLITEAGFRSQKREGPAVPDREGALKVLQDRYLIRSDERGGVRWWELSHDRLIEPVKADNDKWLHKNLESWKLKAAEWHQREEDDALLLRGEEYSQARLSVANNGDATNDIERRFVERSERKLADERAVERMREKLQADQRTIESMRGKLQADERVVERMRRNLDSVTGVLVFSAGLNVWFTIREVWKRWRGRG
jgi:hypothetical protein